MNDARTLNYTRESDKDARYYEVMERQIDRIKQAEDAMKELLKIAAQLRQEVERAGSSNPDQVRELLEAAQGFELEAKRVKDSLRDWREDIN